MTTRQNKRQKFRHTLVFGLMLYTVYLPVTANAETRSESTALTPETREAVRNVGRALLQAKRHYIPPQDTTALRENIKRVRRQIISLSSPVNNSTPINISRTTGTSIMTSQPLSVIPDWEQTHADDIQQLNAATRELRQQCQTLRRKIMPVAQPRSLVNSVMSFFTSAPASQADAGPAVITPVTSTVLTRLEQIESDVTEALALPMAERQKRLESLAVSLKFNDQPAEIDDGQKERRTVTPTLSSRTQHRQE